MAAHNFRLKVITPAGVAIDEQIDSIKLPTVAGEVGVLPQHTRYSGVIGEGSAEFTTESGVKKLHLSGGIVQFSDSTLTVLADTVSEG